MEEVIRHHGIKGMKWGVRRTEAQLARARGSGSSSSSRGLGTKSVKSMSDDELKRTIDRLELEKRYRGLVTEERTASISRGKAFATRVIEKIGENTITNLGTQAANHILGNMINKAFKVSSDDVKNRVVNPQKGQTDKK